MSGHILITSIPSWNQKSGSNTFSTLFESFDREKLANIYISGQAPDSNVCSRYFRINEMAVVRSTIKRNLVTGCEVLLSENNYTIASTRGKSIKRLRILLWFRELAWKIGNWKSTALNRFLDEFSPDVIVFPIESYPYFNRLNQYIIDRCKPKKVIGYLWDDNFTYKQYPDSIIFKIERFFLRKQVRKLIQSCTSVLAISPKMKEECDKEFGIDSIVLTKPIFNQEEFSEFEVNTPIRILYTGKLIIGRDQTIAKIVDAVQRINHGGTKIILDVYTQTAIPASMRKKIDVPGACVLHEPVPQDEVLKLQKEADVLLFAESLSNKNLTARLSFSTKLTDYFAAGKCVWAVGNEDLGPIDYIKREGAGLVSTSIEEINLILNKIIKDTSIIKEYAKKSFRCGAKKHNSSEIIETLRRTIDR